MCARTRKPMSKFGQSTKFRVIMHNSIQIASGYRLMLSTRYDLETTISRQKKK
ncbi:hypothetical protein ACJX0J_018272, partial [Zea mays]